MGQDELNFETERRRCHEAAISLASQMLAKAFEDSGRVAQCMGPREFGSSWLLEHMAPHDPQFEDQVLQKFLGRFNG